MLHLTRIAGQASDPAIAGQLHRLEHAGAVEFVRLSQADMSRRRLHARTDRGTDVAILLDRDAPLQNGSVLFLDAQHAVVVQLDEPAWLPLSTASLSDALELGYFVGNMHWKVRFEHERICIAMEGPRDHYLARLTPLIERGVVRVPPPAASVKLPE